MNIESITAAAYHRQPPDGMTLAEIKLYYSLVLLYTLNHLGQLTVEEGQKKKKEFITAYHQELGAVDFMRENPEMKCKDALRALRSRQSGSEGRAYGKYTRKLRNPYTRSERPSA